MYDARPLSGEGTQSSPPRLPGARDGRELSPGNHSRNPTPGRDVLRPANGRMEGSLSNPVRYRSNQLRAKTFSWIRKASRPSSGKGLFCCCVQAHRLQRKAMGESPDRFRNAAAGTFIVLFWPFHLLCDRISHFGKVYPPSHPTSMASVSGRKMGALLLRNQLFK